MKQACSVVFAFKYHSIDVICCKKNYFPREIYRRRQTGESHLAITVFRNVAGIKTEKFKICSSETETEIWG